MDTRYKRVTFNLNDSELATDMLGDIYITPNGDEAYMLAQVAPGKYALVSLKAGNRWHDGVTKENLDYAFVSKSYGWTRTSWHRLGRGESVTIKVGG